MFCPKVSLKDLGGFTLRDVEMQSRTGVTAWLGGADWYWSQSTISGVNAHLGRQTRQKVLLFNRSTQCSSVSVSAFAIWASGWGAKKRWEEPSRAPAEKPSVPVSNNRENVTKWACLIRWSQSKWHTPPLRWNTFRTNRELECKLNHSYKCTHLPQRLCNHSKRCFNFILHFQNPQQKKCECFLELL